MRAARIASIAVLVFAGLGAGTPATALPSTALFAGATALSMPLLLPARHHHHRHRGRRAWQEDGPAEPLSLPDNAGVPRIGSSETPTTIPTQRYPQSGNQTPSSAPPAIRWVNPGPSGR